MASANETAIRYARDAARALDELGERATKMSKEILEDPAGAWAFADSGESLAHLIHVATTRLAKVEMLFDLKQD
jgi:hypothetical protein